MIRNLLVLPAIMLAMFFISCSGEKKSGAGRPRIIYDPKDSLARDSIEFYETDFEARQNNDRSRMIGKWNVKTMRRQQKAELESLSGVFIEFGRDSLFRGNAGCNNMRGNYILKGVSVVFKKISSTRMACDNMEKESAFLNLLENRVSAYTVTDNKLLLRDGASNIVFECER